MKKHLKLRLLRQIGTALHTFGKQQFGSKKVTRSASTLKKKSQKFKMSVQPEAVKRRKIKNGSKRALAKGITSSIIPVKEPSMKRKHNFSVNVLQNEPVAKKAGRHMSSKTKAVINVKTTTKLTKNEPKK